MSSSNEAIANERTYCRTRHAPRLEEAHCSASNSLETKENLALYSLSYSWAGTYSTRENKAHRLKNIRNNRLPSNHKKRSFKTPQHPQHPQHCKSPHIRRQRNTHRARQRHQNRCIVRYSSSRDFSDGTPDKGGESHGD